MKSLKIWWRSPLVDRCVTGLLLVALIFLLARLWGNGLTSGDEGFTAFAKVRLGGFWRAAFEMASSQGRFYQLYVYILAQIPYLGESLPIINSCRIVSSGLVFIACYYFVKQLWGRDLAAIVSVFAIGLVQTVGGGYNPFHGLPFWFNSGLMFLFISFGLYVKSLRQNISSLPAALLGFVALLHYEPFILFFPTYFLIFINFRSGGDKLTNLFKKFLKLNRSLVVLPIIYLTLYFGFKKMFPSDYAGTKFSIGPIHAMLSTIWHFSMNGIFTEIAKRNFDVFDWRALTTTIVLGSVFVIKVRQIYESERSFSSKEILLASMVVIPFVFLPNVLFAFTERYRQWVLSEPYYLGSFYSGFAICIFLGLFTVFIFSSSLSRKAKNYILTFYTAVFSLIVYCHQIHSLRFFDASKNEAVRWALADDLGAAILKESLPVNYICTESLLTIDDPYDYWSYYLSDIVSKQISLKYAKGTNPNCDSYLDYSREGIVAIFELKSASGIQLKVIKISEN